MVSVVSLAFLFTSYSSNAQVLEPNQTYTTGNIVINTNQGGPSSWVNGVYQDSLTCWSGGMPGYCGPNAIVRPGNNINFSYGMTDLHQVQAIANVLPNSGTGLRVNGFNFGFTAKNGNGWDDARQDYLVAYVNFYGSDGNLSRNYDYGLSTNRKYNWTTFNFSETFDTPYAAKDLSSVRYGFVGRDNNFWAGPYGPEINNISFSLKYSVDPCASDVLSSPTCPGYLDAIAKLTPTSSSSTVTSEPVVTSTNTLTTSPVVNNIVPEVSTATPTNASTSTAPVPVVSSPTSTASSTPTATNPQPKVGEVTVSGSPAKATISTSQILSIVRGEQSRIGNLETSTAQQATEQAQAASDKAQQESLSVSASTISQSQSSAQAAVSMANSSSKNLTNTNNNVQSGVTASSPIQNQNSNRNDSLFGIKLPDNESTPSQAPVSRQQNIYSLIPSNNQNNIASNAPQVSSTVFRNESQKTQNEEVQKTEIISFSGMNPVLNILNSPQQKQNESVESKSTTAVNTKVQDNDIAGTVNLGMLAVQPKGFDTYGGVLADVSFYPPKEVYRNQKVVDNNRALRQLSSDRLHQEMVNQQYGK